MDLANKLFKNLQDKTFEITSKDILTLVQVGIYDKSKLQLISNLIEYYKDDDKQDLYLKFGNYLFD